MSSHHHGQRTPKVINLALQGGGAHGAYTWGVLDRLLEDPRIRIEGISATSAGAMNAAVLAQGLTEGGRERAREALEGFWRSVSRAASLSPLQPTWLDRWFGNWNMDYSPAYLAFDLLTRTFSPNQFNPLDLSPLRDLLIETIDFERLRCCTAVKLFVSATNVRTGRIKVFETENLSADVLMASACLPFLHRTVEIDGEPYWDGGYMGNPAIYPLIYHCAAPDVVIVRINPIRREELPRTAREILNRVNEISFNSSLLRELRVIGFVSRLIDQGLVKNGTLKRVLVHGIDAEEYLAGLGYSSKLNPAWDFLVHLCNLGRDSAGRWLEANFDRLGVESSLDIDGEFLEGAALLSQLGARPECGRAPQAAPHPSQGQTGAHAGRTMGAALSAKGAVMKRDWRRAGVELSMYDVMAEPIVHLVMRRDHLTAGDIWAVVKEAQRQQRLKIEANAASSISLAADEENRGAS